MRSFTAGSLSTKIAMFTPHSALLNIAASIFDLEDCHIVCHMTEFMTGPTH